MTFQPTVISNIRTGLEQDVKEFLLPKDAFVELLDVLPFRGRIEKKEGHKLLNRLVEAVVDESLGNTAGVNFNGSFANTEISPGSITFEFAAPQSETFTDAPSSPFDGTGTLTGSAGGSGTVNYFLGTFTTTVLAFAGASAVTVTYDYYPMRPVMGLRTRELVSIQQEQLVAFDTERSNVFSNALNRFLDINFYKTTGESFDWTGDDLDFFYTSNFQRAFFATNSVEGDHTFVITAISSAASAVITYSGGDVFVNGDIIAITNVVSSGATVVNGITGTVSAHGVGTITVNIDTSAGFTYGTGGVLHSLTRSISGDGIRWYDGTGWVNFQPPLSQSSTGTNVEILQGALILIPYKNTMIALNTTEGPSQGNTINYAQRARWGARYQTDFYNNLTPSGSPSEFFDPDAWIESPPGKGGFVDAATNEQIVGASLIKDTLIVDFERSTWQLRTTGDANNPFVWERIDSELGGISTFAPINLDQGRVTIGNYGATMSDAVSVKRIDQIIPDIIYSIRSTPEGVDRVYGIRDFVRQFALWTYPNSDENETTRKYPNRVLAYNYIDGSFSILRESFTCFGQYTTFNDLRWIDLPKPWETENYTWTNFNLAKNSPILVAGNQQGFVLELFQNGTINDVSLQVESIAGVTVTSSDHNLRVGNYVQFRNGSEGTGSTSAPYLVTSASQNQFTVDATSLASYGQGTTILVLTNILIRTKAFNPYWADGQQVRLGRLDYLVDASEEGEFSCRMFVNQDFDGAVQTLSCPSKYRRKSQEKVWFRVQPTVQGQFVTIDLFYSDAQMRDISKSQDDFALHVLVPWFAPAGRLITGSFV